MSSSHPYTAVDDEDDTDICPVCDGQCTCRLDLDVNYQPTPPAAPPFPSLKIKFTLPPSLIAKRQQPPVSDPYTTPLKKRGRPPKHALTLPPQKNTANNVRQSLKARATVSKKVVKRRRVAVQSDQDESYSSDPSYKHDQHNFPTFLSASALSSICSSSSSSASCLSDFDADADSDLQAEEESFIVADIHHKARLKRELLGRDDPQLKNRSPPRDWVIRPRKKSVGGSDAEQMDDVDTDDQADNQDEDDEEEEEEPVQLHAVEEDGEEPDALHPVEEDDEDTDGTHRYTGLATGWSEEDESSFDADLFFANLSDSSSTSSSSSTSTRRRCHSCTPGAIDADQSSSTSESPSKTALPFEVTQNWDGHLIFTNGLVGDAESRGIVDIDFEKDAERFIMDSVDSDADDDSCSSYAGADHHQLNCEPPSIVQATESSDVDMFSISDGYEEDGGEADEGDTTDEELVGDDALPNERAMSLFTLPMPIAMGVSAINPMSIVSPTVGLEQRRHRRRMNVGGERKIRRRGLRLGTGGTGPRAADILAGKTVFWEDESRDGYASSSSISPGKGKQKASFSPSSPTSHVNHPSQTHTPRRGLFVPTAETRQAVIGEGTKGTDVPSPHPRFYGRRRRSKVSVVQYLLKKHLQSQSQSSVPATATNSVSSPSIISDAPSPFHHLLSSSAASPLTATEDLTSTTTTPGGDEYDTGNSTPYPCPAEVEVNDLACIVELDDVLEASFLDDSVDRECEAGVGSASKGATLEDLSTTLTTATTTPSVDSTATVEASNKHLTRWDVISIGAFRQTREQQQQQAWGPGSRSSFTVGDYGGVIKNGASAAGSPLSALLWQNSGAGSSSAGAGSSKKTTPTSSSTLKTSTSRSSTKAAKRRRLMMASSTMSSPLVLPLSSTSLSTPSKSHSSFHHTSYSQPNNSTTHKTRKELRREKKLLKKKTPTSSSPSSSSQPFFSTHPNSASNNNHQFHTHQHHPNSKTRGVSSLQRMGSFGGTMPPLNL